MVKRKDVVERRRKLQQMANRSYIFRKGDKRAATPRICVVCGRPLTSLIINEGKYVTSHNHTRYYVEDVLTLDCCLDINSCYRTLRQKGELVEDVVIKEHS